MELTPQDKQRIVALAWCSVRAALSEDYEELGRHIRPLFTTDTHLLAGVAAAWVDIVAWHLNGGSPADVPPDAIGFLGLGDTGPATQWAAQFIEARLTGRNHRLDTLWEQLVDRDIRSVGEGIAELLALVLLALRSTPRGLLADAQTPREAKQATAHLN